MIPRSFLVLTALLLAGTVVVGNSRVERAEAEASRRRDSFFIKRNRPFPISERRTFRDLRQKSKQQTVILISYTFIGESSMNRIKARPRKGLQKVQSMQGRIW